MRPPWFSGSKPPDFTQMIFIDGAPYQQMPSYPSRSLHLFSFSMFTRSMRPCSALSCALIAFLSRPFVPKTLISDDLITPDHPPHNSKPTSPTPPPIHATT